MSGYIELHAHSAYSFAVGACLPREMVRGAKKLELSGLALLDYDGVYGLMEARAAARQAELPFLPGCEFTLEDQTHLPIICRSSQGYSALTGAISSHHLAAGRREADRQNLAELAQWAKGQWLVLTGTRAGPLRRVLYRSGIAAAARFLEQLKELFGAENIAVEAALAGFDGEESLAAQLDHLARKTKLPLVATSAARCANPASQRLADVMTATRLARPLDKIQDDLPACHAMLRSEAEMLRIHRQFPGAVDNAAQIGKDLIFDFSTPAPHLPLARVPPGYSADSYLEQLSWQGARSRYGDPVPGKAAETIQQELKVIFQKGFSGYFLIVKEIVDYCFSSGIYVQGRGSAANSAVCYCLGITAVDAVRHQMLFDRFLTPDRKDLPDIDLDIESNQREKVLQHVYAKYGRENAAQVANVISYRPRAALKDAARVLGYDARTAAKWARLDRNSLPENVQKIAGQLQKLPRHLGIHCGGMVLSDKPLTEVAAINWANMPGRTVVQWDKDSCAEAGLVKIDLLSLGMMGALRTAFETLQARGEKSPFGKPWRLHKLPPEDPRVYQLLQAADTVGVFQVESRAQMSTLPRLKPKCFYDLVVEVALIRPAPIQGQAVNPYLARRLGREKVTYLHPLLKPALERTLGVPLFQEQLMRIAKDAAGFNGSQSDNLRRAMGRKNPGEHLADLRAEFFKGMEKNQIPPPVQEKIWAQMSGFAEFGFPESHAFSFAYLVYASAWLKAYYPAVFYAAILANQPMGFYSPQSLISDARRHGLKILRPDVNTSQKDSIPGTDLASLKLGLAEIRGIRPVWIEKILAARNDNCGRRFKTLEDFTSRSQLPTSALELLATAGALSSLGVTRRESLWRAPLLAAPQKRFYQPELPGLALKETTPPFAPLTTGEQVQWDSLALGISLWGYPTKLVRPELTRRGILPAAGLRSQLAGKRIRCAGIVTHRQRPHTAKGVVFLSLEDETGLVNVICQVGCWQRYRRLALSQNALIVRGVLQAKDGALALLADKIEPLNLPVPTKSRDFR